LIHENGCVRAEYDLTQNLLRDRRAELAHIGANIRNLELDISRRGNRDTDAVERDDLTRDLARNAERHKSGAIVHRKHRVQGAAGGIHAIGDADGQVHGEISR
jgi:hypothetical protein